MDKKVSDVLINPSFRKNVLYALKVFGPLVRVLHLDDGKKKPAMGYIYKVMDRIKETVAYSFQDNATKYDGILR